MNQARFADHYHELRFKLICHEQKGAAFQDFFEKVMMKYDSSFISVKPSGREGDWKCDGFSQNSGTLYQCYAPEEITTTKAANKIIADFNGAKEKWKSEMRKWVFVWSAHGALPPQVTKVLLRLKAENPDVETEDWNRENLWQIIRSLTLQVREDLLGIVPEVIAATDTTAAEVETLLNFLIRQDIPMLSDDTEQIDIVEKLKRNNLSESVYVWIRTATPIARDVGEYTQRHPDIDFSKIIASSLVDKYKRLTEGSSRDSDYVFGALVEYVSQGKMSQPKIFWAAVGIVCYYFQLCDLFER